MDGVRALISDSSGPTTGATPSSSLLALCSISNPAEVEDGRTTNAMGRRVNVKDIKKRGGVYRKGPLQYSIRTEDVETGIAPIG